MIIGVIATSTPDAVVVTTPQPTEPTTAPVPPSPEPTVPPVSPTDTPLPPTPTPGPILEFLTAVNYTDSIDYEHIIGVIQNVSDKPLDFVKVVATVYDADGNVAGTGFTYTDLDTLAPGEKSTFDVTADDWGEWATFNLQAEGNQAQNMPRRDVMCASHRQYIDDIGYLHVQGEVSNQGAGPASFVKVIVTFYKADGEIAGSTFVYTDLDTVAPGGTSPFDAATEYYWDVDHYEVQVQAN